MKKLYLLLVALVATISVKAQVYDLVINGSTHISTVATDPFEGFDQFKAENVTLAANDIITVFNQTTGVEWALTKLNPASSSKVASDANGIRVNEAGTFNIYLKMKFGQDEIYIGDADPIPGGGDEPNPGGNDDPITPPTPVEGGAYYLVGYINGENVGEGDVHWNEATEYVFVNGIVNVNFTGDEYGYNYVYVKQGEPDNWIWYMSAEYATEGVATMTIASETISEKMLIPSGPHTISLTENADASITLRLDAPISSSVESIAAGTIYVNGRTIMGTDNMVIFNLSGQNVTTQNGNLATGIYLVRTINACQKVIVK